MKNVRLHNDLLTIKEIVNMIPHCIKEKVEIKNDQIIHTDPQNLTLLLSFLKNHKLLQFKTLISITGVDYPEYKNRFEVNYFLLSYKINERIIVKTTVGVDSVLPSAINIFPSAGWYEREVWDTFGVFFSGHPDLRRILTDYGFEGFPFRKDFPQTGFVEVRYDDEKKHVVYEPLELTQDYRSYTLTSPWVSII